MQISLCFISSGGIASMLAWLHEQVQHGYLRDVFFFEVDTHT
jgi:hypothetical protein